MNIESISSLASPLREQRALFERHIEPLRPDLWRYCFRLTGSEWDAEDLVQDTLVRAFGRLAHFWRPVAPRAYLFQIATNLWIDRVSPSPALDPWPLPEEQAVEDGAWERLEAREALEAAATALPPRQRSALLLVEVFGFRASEVAAMMGAASAGSVKALLHRARRNLEHCRTASKTITTSSQVGPLVQRLVEAFNQRDLDAFAQLLLEDVRVDIVGVAEEVGREEARASSLKGTFADPDAEFAASAVLEGVPMILLCHRDAGTTVLSEILRLEAVDGAVSWLRSYYFCPELLEAVAAKLVMPVKTHGYQYLGEG